jgi:hypothetical protein
MYIIYILKYVPQLLAEYLPFLLRYLCILHITVKVTGGHIQFSFDFQNIADIRIDCGRAGQKNCEYAVEDPQNWNFAFPQLL